jgi:putative transposase
MTRIACSGSDICIVDACEPAFGRTYDVSVFNLTINTTNPKGTSWDSVGGAPDPYVVISINDGEVLYTSEVQDTFEPTFADSTTVVIPAGAKFRFDAWDSDVDPADWIIGCEIDPLTADYLRAFGPTCTGTAETGTLGTVLVTCLPRSWPPESRKLTLASLPPELPMRISRFNDEQKVRIIRETDRDDVPVVAKRHAVSVATLYAWKRRFGTLSVDDTRRLRALETENAKLKKLLGEKLLELDVLKEINAKKW